MTRDAGDEPSWLGPSESSGERGDDLATRGAARFSEGRELGAGGGGRVVEGRDEHLAREVALKIVGPERPTALARLRREAAILVALEHPSIVPLYDLIERADGGLQLAMRIVRGRSLESALAGSRPAGVPIALTRHLARAAEAVAWAHHRGFVHRDLKPANIMIGEFGETQVIDWGLALRAGDRPTESDERDPDDAAGAHLTHAGAVLGTPRYMSPEQARGERVDARADVWALGAILFEILAGRPAFDAAESRAVLAAVRAGRAPSLRDGRPDMPADLGAIVHKAMAELDERYPDARAFVDDLNAWLDGRPVAAHRYAFGQRVARFVRRQRARLALGALALGLVATVGAIAVVAGVEPEVVRDESLTASLREDLGERDRHLGHALALEAQTLALAGHTPEAATTAARALAASGSPIARGVLAATQPWPRVESAVAIPGAGCLSLALHPDGERWLCRGADAIALWRGAVRVWQTRVVSHAAAFVDDGASVIASAPGRRIVTLATDDGAVRGERESPCGDDLVPGSNRRALVRSRSCAALVGGDRVEPIVRGVHMQAVAVAADGRTAVLALDGTLRTTGADGTVESHPVELGATLDDVTAMALDEGGVALGTLRGELLRLAPDGRVALRRELLRDVPITALTPIAGALAVTLDRGGPLVVDVLTLQALARLPGTDRGPLIAWSDGRLATLSPSRLAHWRIDRGRVTRLVDIPAITSFDFDDDHLAVAHGTAISWLALGEGGRAATRDVGDKVKSIAIDRGATRVLWSADHTATLGAATLPELAPLVGPAVWYSRRLALSAGGRIVALPYRAGIWLGTLDGDGALFGNELWVDLAIQGELIAVLAAEDEAALFELGETPRELARCALADPIALSLTPDGEHFVVAAVDGVRLVDAADCSLAAWLGGRPDGSVPRFTDVQVSRDGVFIAAGSREGDVLVWDRDGRLRGAVVLHAQRVAQLGFDRASRLLASAGWDGTIAFVDLSTLGRDDAGNVAMVRAALGY